MQVLLLQTGWKSSVLSILTLIIAFVIVIFLAYFTSKFIANYQKNTISRNSNFEIIESFKIGPNKFLAIIKVGTKYYCIGLGKDEIVKIDTLNPEDFKLSNDMQSKSSFSEILTKLKKSSEDKNTDKDK